MTFNMFTRIISTYTIRNPYFIDKRFKYKRTTHYELRKKSPARSQTDFEYYALNDDISIGLFVKKAEELM